MPDEKPKTINEEAGLPDNWVPVDRPPVEPGRQNPNALIDGNLKYLQGSLPPTYQHDSSFVNTAYKSASAPSASLIPLGLQGNPSTNAAIQSTASHTPSQVPSSVTTTLSVNVPPQLFTPPFQDIALPGTLTINLSDQSANQFFAGPTTGSPATPTWRALVLLDFGFVFDVPHGGTGVATIPAHAVIIGAGTSPITTAAPGTAGFVLTSTGATTDPTFQALPSFPAFAIKINGTGTAIDKQFFINGITDGASVWGVSINGTPDGG